MLASPGPVPEGAGWSYEIKWDGVRGVAAVSGAALRIRSRNDKPLAQTYPELDELRRLVDRPMVLDGEIVALDANGIPDFALLQKRMHRRNPAPGLVLTTPVVLYVFDVLHLDGRDLTRLPYEQRRSVLEELGLDGDAVKTPPRFVNIEGALVLATAERHGLEGVVAKRTGSRYEPGRRSSSWVKTPLRRTAEVVVAGWTPGQGRRAGAVGALLLAVPGEDGLRFVGNVGTGFTDAVLAEMSGRLAALERPAAAFAEPVPREFARDARWVEPVLVGEVEYRSVSPDGRLRHPSWRGLRPDRSPSDVPDLVP